MSVILRVDDFPGTKPDEFWKHNLDNFRLFDGVLSKYVDQYVLGVIPRHTTPEMVEFLAVNERIVVALHGVEHDERFMNEFREHETEQDICDKVTSAVYPLRRCNGTNDITDYIPPHNVIDRKTARALKRRGFRRVFGGPGMDQTMCDSVVEEGLDLLYSPHPLWYGRSDEMMARGSVAEIKREARGCVTLHWPWEWNIGLQNLDTFLHQISEVF